MDEPRKRRWFQFGLRTWLVWVCLLPALGGVVYAWVVAMNAPPPLEVHPIAFDAAQWKAATPLNQSQPAGAGNRYRTIRSAMIDDLLKRYSFVGYSREQVVALLGYSDYFPKRLKHGQNDIRYKLGMQRSWAALDNEYLVFEFDPKDKVVRWYLAID